MTCWRQQLLLQQQQHHMDSEPRLTHAPRPFPSNVHLRPVHAPHPPHPPLIPTLPPQELMAAIKARTGKSEALPELVDFPEVGMGLACLCVCLFACLFVCLRVTKGGAGWV